MPDRDARPAVMLRDAKLVDLGALGYARSKTQHVYRKHLDDQPTTPADAGRSAS